MKQALVTSAVLAVALFCPLRGDAADAGADAGAPCVAWRTEARFGAVGYNHVVLLKNRCDLKEVCTVSTNVNPAPQKAVVSPRAEVEVVTFLGSPASVFVANVDCRPERR